MPDRIVKVKPGYWVKIQHRTSGSPKQQEVVNVGADERIIVQREAYVEPPPPDPEPEPEPPPTGTRVATAPTDGSDATIGLNADIRATPNGGTLQLVAGASYRVNGVVGQDNRNGITVDFRGARCYQTVTRPAAMWQFEHWGNDVHFKGPGTIEGTNVNATFSNATEGGHGIAFGGIQRGGVKGLTFRNLWGDGVYIVGGWQVGGAAFRYAEDIAVTDNDIATVGRMGVALTDGERNIHVERNKIDRCGWYGVDIEPNGLTLLGQPIGADHVWVDDNDFGAVMGLNFPGNPNVSVIGFPAGSAGTPPPMSDLFFTNNRVKGHAFSMYSSKSTRYQRVTISGNSSDLRVSFRPIQISNVDGLTFTNNVQPMNPSGSPMLNCETCTNVTQSGNVTT